MKEIKDCFIPVVMAFDHNYVIMAGVCITSLFYNARKQDVYRVICLIDSDVTDEDQGEFKYLINRFPRHEIVFMQMGDSFSDAYTQTLITKSAYYRLLIPRILPEYKKVIYADVDIIFCGSLSDLFFHEDMRGVYLGVVKDVWINLHRSDLLVRIGCPPLSYFNSGFLLMNIEEINKDHLTDLFMELVDRNYEFMDQDVLNVVCKGRVRYLSPKYNGLNFGLDSKDDLPQQWTQQEIAAVGETVRHYAGRKPWRLDGCQYGNFSELTLWWFYYWRTPFRNKQALRYYVRCARLLIKRIIQRVDKK